jgi:hypothetical protein
MTLVHVRFRAGRLVVSDMGIGAVFSNEGEDARECVSERKGFGCLLLVWWSTAIGELQKGKEME